MPATEPSSARRRRSRDAVLGGVRGKDGITRRRLEQSTGLSRSTVAAAVADLLEQGLLEEHQHAGTSRGRPSTLLRIAHPGGLVIGIDFGHAHVAVALADTQGVVRAERRRELDVDAQATAALDGAAELVAEVLSDDGRTMDDVAAVAAGIPGPIDATSNVVRSPTILASWVDVDPEQELARRIGGAVHAGNDADMGARGEQRYGSARGLRDFLYLKVSHGIGAGLVFNGEVYRGATGLTGEIGHTQIDQTGGWCRCGNRDCLETVVSVPRIRERLRDLAPPGAESEPVTDPVSIRIVTDAGRIIGRVVADLCNCLNPAAVIVGGELAILGDAALAGIRESFDRYAQPATARAVDVRPAELGLRSELLGAVAYAIDFATLPR